jgi:hypothetical protein
MDPVYIYGCSVEVVGEEGGEEGEGRRGQRGRAAGRRCRRSSCSCGAAAGCRGLGLGGEHGGGRRCGGDEHGEGDLLHLHFFFGPGVIDDRAGKSWNNNS